MKNIPKKNIIIGVLVALVLLLFAFHISNTLEWVILIAVLLLMIYFASEYEYILKKKPWLIIVALAVWFGLFYWMTENDRIRSREECIKVGERSRAEYLEKIKQDSIMKIRINELSDSLYRIEGDRIFGNFFFGMSETEFEKQTKIIDKETNGYVSLRGNDFYIEKSECLFFHNQLYKLTLISKQEDYIDYELSSEEISQRIASQRYLLYNLFKDKYGSPHDENGWHFPYKDIEVFYSRLNPFVDENSELYKWGSVIRISKPSLVQLVEEEREKEKLKRKEAKAKQDSIERTKREKERQKKESFVEGI